MPNHINIVLDLKNNINNCTHIEGSNTTFEVGESPKQKKLDRQEYMYDEVLMQENLKKLNEFENQYKGSFSHHQDIVDTSNIKQGLELIQINKAKIINKAKTIKT